MVKGGSLPVAATYAEDSPARAWCTTSVPALAAARRAAAYCCGHVRIVCSFNTNTPSHSIHLGSWFGVQIPVAVLRAACILPMARAGDNGLKPNSLNASGSVRPVSNLVILDESISPQRRLCCWAAHPARAHPLMPPSARHRAPTTPAGVITRLTVRSLLIPF